MLNSHFRTKKGVGEQPGFMDWTLSALCASWVDSAYQEPYCRDSAVTSWGFKVR